jgi:hypothetical protein
LTERKEKTTAEQWCSIGRTLRRLPFADEPPGLKLDWRSLEIKGSRATAAVQPWVEDTVSRCTTLHRRSANTKKKQKTHRQMNKQMWKTETSRKKKVIICHK